MTLEATFTPAEFESLRQQDLSEAACVVIFNAPRPSRPPWASNENSGAISSRGDHCFHADASNISETMR